MGAALTEGPPAPERRTVLPTVALATVLLIAQAVAMTSLALDPVAEHAVGHAAMAVPFLLLLVLVLTVWPAPPPTRLGRMGRVGLIAGLAGVGGGGLSEAAGALGYAESRPNETLQAVHDLGVLVTLAGLPLLVLGVVLSIAALAVWRGWVRRRLFWGAVAAFLVLVALYLTGALVFGLY